MRKNSKSKPSRLGVHLDRGPGAVRMKIGECFWVVSSRTAMFEWSQEALAAGVDLSPFKMPSAGGLHEAGYAPFAGLHPLFSDSIPDGFGLRSMNKGRERAGYDLDEVNPLHRLAWVGERGAGGGS